MKQSINGSVSLTLPKSRSHRQIACTSAPVPAFRECIPMLTSPFLCTNRLPCGHFCRKEELERKYQPTPKLPNRLRIASLQADDPVLRYTYQTSNSERSHQCQSNGSRNRHAADCESHTLHVPPCAEHRQHRGKKDFSNWRQRKSWPLGEKNMLNGTLVSCDFRNHSCGSRLEDSCFQFTFPYCDDIPSQRGKLPGGFFISIPVGNHLLLPKSGVRFWKTVILAVVAMPKAAVDENDRLVFWENDVGCAGKFLDIYPVAESLFPQIVAQLTLRLGVDGLYP